MLSQKKLIENPGFYRTFHNSFSNFPGHLLHLFQDFSKNISKSQDFPGILLGYSVMAQTITISNLRLQKTNFWWSEKLIYYWKLQTLDKLIFNIIKGEAGYDGINDLMHCSEGDLSKCFLSFLCDVKAASFILATLTSSEQ